MSPTAPLGMTANSMGLHEISLLQSSRSAKCAPMRILSTAVVVALLGIASITPIRAESSNVNDFVLKPAQRIGVGWKTDKFGWMGYVSFSPDGGMIASDAPSTPDDVSGDLTIWSFPEGRLIKRLPGRPWSMSSDWKYYADHDGVREARNGKTIISLPNDAYAVYAFDQGGSRVVESFFGKDKANSGIQIFELGSVRRVAAFGRQKAFALAVSPDGRTLASGHWDIVMLRSMLSGSRLASLRGAGGYVEGISFSRDGNLLAAGTDRGRVEIWDLRQQRKLHSIDLEGSIVSAPAFSPNGQLVAAGTYGTGTVWLIDVRNGTVLDRKKVSDLGCGSVAFSPDGRYLVTPSTGGLMTWPLDLGGTIRVFRIQSGARDSG